jgi:hypothetical protein
VPFTITLAGNTIEGKDAASIKSSNEPSYIAVRLKFEVVVEFTVLVFSFSQLHLLRFGMM